MKSKPRKPRRKPQGAATSSRVDATDKLPALERVQVWDLPTRLSHWAILVLFVFQVLSGQFSLAPAAWHLWAGYCLLVVVLFRLAWSLVGSESARLGTMIASLRGLPGYLPRLFSRQPTRWPGHNPVGALSSLLLLLLLLISCLSGLFIETWADDRGPLAERVSRGFGILMADIHGLVRWPLYLLALVHVLAALAYLGFKREDRIGPIFGRGRIAIDGKARLTFASNRRAVLVLAICLAGVMAIVRLGPIS